MFKSSGEEFLVENGVLQKRTPTQKIVLGCVACRWNACITSGDTPVVYGQQIANCSNLGSGTVYDILRRIEGGGAVTSAQEAVDPTVVGRPARVHYMPADTELGAAFTASLQVPPECGLTGSPVTIRANETSTEQI